MKKSSANVYPKASLVTLGCPMNQVDSEKIIGKLARYGFEIVNEEDADIVVVNTCGFIESAREESIETILSVADLKKNGKLKAVVVVGCLAQRFKDELERDLAEVDAVIGLTEAEKIPEVCCELLNYKKPEKEFYSRVLIGSPYSAYLKITEGCSNKCSYCAIPMIRGPFRSVIEDDILKEARELAELGIKELIVIGQDTTRYGSDISGVTLPGLLEKINALEGIEWIRLMYAHPMHLKKELIESIAKIPKVVPYIDLPLQHISGDVLKRMGRATPPGKIIKLIAELRERIEGLVLRTAFIVGFPGETEKEFNELVKFIEKQRFERLGVFEYSVEENTKAALLEDSVSEDVKLKRYETLMEIQSDISADFNKSLIGKEFDMIVEERDNDSGEAIGRTYMDAPEIDGNIKVAEGVEEGKAFCRIRVTGAETYDLLGEVI